ncbi:MAG: hypothetical protein Q8K68_10895 [Nitrospirota bacterium]|nr:hypothetical protein [Nitrospirota bacterium]
MQKAPVRELSDLWYIRAVLPDFADNADQLLYQCFDNTMAFFCGAIE